MNKKIKVLIVDDSAFMRKVVKDILEEDELITVVGTARDGFDALKKVQLVKPDIVTLDVEMPRKNGLQTLRELMEKEPIPVIMLSSLTKEGAEITLEALELGAVDFIAKPTNIYNNTFENLKFELKNKIKKLISSKIIRRTRPEQLKLAYKPEQIKITTKDLGYIVAIGTSTGGPSALKELLVQFPEDIPASFLIVQHMPPNFTKSLAERLNNICEINVKEADNNDKLEQGWAYIAPGDYHLRLEKHNNQYFTNIKQDSFVNAHRPSVDVLFDSIARNYTEKVFSIILTGMGKDGSEGLKKINNNIKALNIAQNEKTCVVYGMPKAALNTGKIDLELPVQEIGKAIIDYMSERR